MKINIYEDLACEYLCNKGLMILTRNYAWPGGEIDIILRDQQELVFVEVKFRRSEDYGCPLEKISQQQIRRIHNTAAHFLEDSPQYEKTFYRFDAIGITPLAIAPPSTTHQLYPPDIYGDYQIDWITNAF